MLTKKTKYALKALICMAKRENEMIQIAELSSCEKIPQKFLESILLELRKHGILESKRGKEGGYKLGKEAREITLGQVIRVLDGPLAPIPCVSKIAYKKCDECMDEATCEIRQVMQKVRDSTAEILDNTRLSDIVKNNLLEKF